MDEKKNTTINIEAFRAKNGDSFLVNFQDYFFLIDTGFKDTYLNYIEPRLVELKREGKVLNKFIITHIDEDHIQGAIPFISANGKTSESNIIRIEQVWHNSYRHLHRGEEKAEISEKGKQQLTRLTTSGNSLESMVSARQGSSLAGLLLSGKYNWNSDFDGGPVLTSGTTIKIDEGISFTLLSPTAQKLEKLERFWKKELKKIGFKDRFGANDLFDDAYEFLLLKEKEINPTLDIPISKSEEPFDFLFRRKVAEDNRPTNGSSIAFVLEIDRKKLLFLGDSHPTVILDSLMCIYGEEPLQFDFVKISHHGSYYNSNLALLNFIDAPKFCISTDGLGHHPNLETLCWIVGRKSTFSRTIYFNYYHSGVEFLNKNDWKSKYNYTLHFPENGHTLNIPI